jgi:photosystem I reaction center subunit VIII
MIDSSFPALFVPIVGLFLPGIAMGILFIYIEKENIE